MEPRWQSDMYGSRNPVAMLFGTAGWGLFVATPWVQVDLRDADRGVVPAVEADPRRRGAAERAQPAAGAGKGLPPIDAIVPGLYDVFVFDAHDPADALEGLRRDHRPGRDAAEVGARLHAVAPHARRRDADARHRRHVPREADSARRGDLSRHRLRAARLEHAAAVVRLQSRRLQARSEGRARRHARAERQGRRAHGAVGSRPAADAARHDSGRSPARRSTPRTSRRYWQQHVGLVQRRHRRVLAGRGRLVQSLRAHQAPSALLPGHRCRRRRTCGRGACSATAIPASRSGAAGSGRATPTRRGRRSRRRSPSASTTR